jgi:exodeoxyribonuclease VII large subunit
VLQARGRSLGEARSRLAHVSPEARLRLAAQSVLALEKRLRSVSPASVLQRGFAIVRDDQGRPVTRRAAIRPGQKLGAEFSDGTAGLRAD